MWCKNAFINILIVSNPYESTKHYFKNPKKIVHFVFIRHPANVLLLFPHVLCWIATELETTVTNHNAIAIFTTKYYIYMLMKKLRINHSIFTFLFLFYPNVQIDISRDSLDLYRSLLSGNLCALSIAVTVPSDCRHLRNLNSKSITYKVKNTIRLISWLVD